MITLIFYVVHMGTQVSCTQFASHVSVNTPTRSFTHGVGDPISVMSRKANNRQPQQYTVRNSRNPPPSQRFVPVNGIGYPRIKPTVPFNYEEVHPTRTLNISPWQQNYKEVTIPALPPSPYKVDSPDPESLWPEGLFIPPSAPPRLAFNFGRRSDIDPYYDPYLLEGLEAIAAVKRSIKHGELYFHEIPHIESLLANQEERVKNNLKPHILGSIRHMWPYNRP